MNKKTFFSAIVALLALAGGLVAQMAMRPAPEPVAAVMPLEFSFPDISDRLQSISQWRGKVLVINFWATWCAPCLQEIPEFIRMQAKYERFGLQFIGVAIEDKQPVAEYLSRIDMNYPVLIAGDAGIGLAQQFGNVINAVPFTVIVNRQGQVVHRQPGELSVANLLDIIGPLLPIQ